MRRIRALAVTAAAGLAAAALAKELAKPAQEREWTGQLGGVVPYDFRLPTLERIRSRVWNPEDPRLFVPQVFGVGWTINLAQLAGIGRVAGD